jgi:hypothetical protein
MRCILLGFIFMKNTIDSVLEHRRLTLVLKVASHFRRTQAASIRLQARGSGRTANGAGKRYARRLGLHVKPGIRD